MRQRYVVFSALVVASTLPAHASDLQKPPPKGCSDCHDGAADRVAYVPPHQALAGSAHRDLSCSDCHESITLDSIDASLPQPHGKETRTVNCGECHDEEAKAYQKHGRLKVGTDPDMPQCWSCHGTHDILAASDRQSHVHPVNLPSTCRACHTDVDLVKRHLVLRDAPIKLYESSVHGQAARKGLTVSATCDDCHSVPAADGKRTAHRILGPGDPESTIYHFKIPDTCGACHKPITQDFWDGVHGQLVRRGAVDAPVCTTCHGEHGIIAKSDPRSPVSKARLAQETCAPCHESAVLNEKYGVPAGRFRSYVDSYHGLKAKAGDVSVANCESCHGAHRILPHTDPTSSIHPENLRKTCGFCHPGISAELAAVPIHATGAGIKSGWARFFTVFYYWLIGITIGLMALHCLGDWVCNVRKMGKKAFVVRLSVNETAQHWVLAISFVLLVISGFSLRFSEAWWVQVLFGWGGGKGFLFRGQLHRIAAVVFIGCSIWHILYLLTQRGRAWFKDMLGAPHDLRHIKESALHFLGIRTEGPRFGRFSYMEKCEYWALMWGGVIMTLTGLLLWFDNYFVERWGLPKGVLDVVLVIHYYEAWLATLAILVWHGYSTVFSPRVYPMNPAWIGGRMPKEMYAEEHPEGPRLKAFIHRRLYEEEEGNDVQEVTSSGGMPAAYPGESDRVKTRAAQSGGEETSKSVDDRAAPSPRGR